MKKRKKIISVSIERKLDNYVNELISNKSKYLEYLVYQDLMKNSFKEELKKIII